MEKQPSILVVDTNQRTRTLLADIFIEHQLTVFEAKSFEEGLFYFNHQSIELVVAEAIIDKGADLAFLMAIRHVSNIPIVTIGDGKDESQCIKSFELGGDDYLWKPFSPREVYLRVRRLLKYYYQSSPFMTSGHHYIFSYMTIDLAQQKVCVAGKNIDLTPMEFQLLVYLVEHPDKVVTRRELLQGVWGYQLLGEERTVDVHIRRLRQKLAKYSDIASSRIVTEYRRGYRFEVDGSKKLE